ncbi:MAG TPA: hypothetical protein DCS93_29735 [Microscillaceae bacterium]|nr:hypothetical protein [Microscillaceae bacterium]
MTKEEIIAIMANTFPFLTTPELDQLWLLGEYRKCANREIIINKGERSNRTFFILKGMVRGYIYTQKGEEKNLFLRPEHTLTGAPDTMFEGVATKYTFEAILETHLLLFHFPQMEQLSSEMLNVARIYIEGLKENLQTLLFRVESLVYMTPEERYEALLKRSPQFFQTAFNKHIANYLGITPVSLSRIIKRRQESEKGLDN